MRPNRLSPANVWGPRGPVTSDSKRLALSMGLSCNFRYLNGQRDDAVESPLVARIACNREEPIRWPAAVLWSDVSQLPYRKSSLISTPTTTVETRRRWPMQWRKLLKCCVVRYLQSASSPGLKRNIFICGVSAWLGAEENAGRFKDTVDMVFGEGEGEDENRDLLQPRRGYQTWVISGSKPHISKTLNSAARTFCMYQVPEGAPMGLWKNNWDLGGRHLQAGGGGMRSSNGSHRAQEKLTKSGLLGTCAHWRLEQCGLIVNRASTR